MKKRAALILIASLLLGIKTQAQQATTNAVTAPVAPAPESEEKPRGLLGLLGFGVRTKVIEPPKPLTLTPASKRLTDLALHNDRQFFAEWQKRVDQVVKKASGSILYQATKADSWLYLAQTEHANRERGSIVEEAFGQATNLVVQLESKTPSVSSETPLVGGSLRVRHDLWALADHLKRQPNFALGASEIARLEVQLVWTGHVEAEHGWRVALPYLEGCEHWAARAWENVEGQGRHETFTASVGTKQIEHRIFQRRGRRFDDLEDLQLRLAQLNDRGIRASDYRFAKAQSWLDFSRTEMLANNRSRITKQTAELAKKLIVAMETGSASPEIENETPDSASRIREDLWKQVDELKQRRNFAKGAAQVARLETELAWAGYQRRTLGWRAARPHVAAAERLAQDADARTSDALVSKSVAEANTSNSTKENKGN